jgi:outer membrane lipoprotein-sorting protein
MTDWWNFLSENAEITGTEKVGDRDCYIIKMKETDSSPYSMLWLDKKDLILVKARSEISGGEKVEMNFSDFRKIDGDMLVPYQTEMFTGGKLMSTVKVLSVEVNQDLSDDLFDVQKADVKGPNMQDMMKMMQKRGKG